MIRGARADTNPNPLRPTTPRAVAVPTAPPKLIAFFEVSHNYKLVKHHMREASRAQGIDYELLQALIATESGFDAAAVSPKGAVGLMQVMPGTYEELRMRHGLDDDPFDPHDNIMAGKIGRAHV